MTSCSDDALMLQVSSTQRTSLGRNDLSPSNYAQLQHKCLVKKEEKNDNNSSLTNLQECVDIGNLGNPAASAISLLQQSLLQTMQNQQHQQMLNDADVDLNKLCQPFVSAAQIDQEKMNRIKDVLQQLAVEQSKALPNGAQNPWINMTAPAPTCHLKGRDANDWPGLSTDNRLDCKKSKMATPGLGDLLPPPPRLPVAPQVEIPRNVSTSFVNSKPFACNTTSPVVYLSPLLKNSESRYTSASHLKIQDTSFSDKNQPLDLSTSTNRNPATYCETTKSNNNATIILEKPESNNLTPPSPTDNNLMLANGNLPPIKSLPAFSQNSDASALVHTFASQYSQKMPLLQSMIEANENQVTVNVANLQKWLLAAQQHQQVTAIQQQQSLRKRSASMEYGNRQSSKHSMLDQYSRPPKTMLLNNGMRASSEKGIALSDQNKTPAAMLNNANSGKRYKRYAKPPYSYVSLITLSILSSAEKKLRLSQILKRISDMFPFFKGSYQGWRDSVRHNLSQNECFVKVLKNPYRPTAKGNYWTVNVAIIPHELLLRQNTLVSRYIQESGFTYRKDLTEVFDILNGNIKIHVPEHLIKGDSLIEQPATVMEVLLLEPKREDDLGSFISSKNSKVYCLGDMFAKDDYMTSDLSRQHHTQPIHRNTWPGKVTSPKVTIVAPKSESPQQTAYPSSSYPPYGTNAELQKFALHMIQNSQESLNAANSNQIQTQKELLAQAFSTLNYLPLLQNLYQLNASQQQPSGKNAAQQRTFEWVEKSENVNTTKTSIQENLSVIEISDSSSAKTSPGSNCIHNIKFEDDNDVKSVTLTSPKDNMIDSDLLNSISLLNTPNCSADNNKLDVKSRPRRNSHHSPIRSSSTKLSGEALFQPGVYGDTVVPPQSNDVLFANFNGRTVGLAKTV